MYSPFNKKNMTKIKKIEFLHLFLELLTLYDVDWKHNLIDKEVYIKDEKIFENKKFINDFFKLLSKFDMSSQISYVKDNEGFEVDLLIGCEKKRKIFASLSEFFQYHIDCNIVAIDILEKEIKSTVIKDLLDPVSENQEIMGRLNYDVTSESFVGIQEYNTDIIGIKETDFSKITSKFYNRKTTDFNEHIAINMFNNIKLHKDFKVNGIILTGFKEKVDLKAEAIVFYNKNFKKPNKNSYELSSLSLEFSDSIIKKHEKKESKIDLDFYSTLNITNFLELIKNFDFIDKYLDKTKDFNKIIDKSLINIINDLVKSGATCFDCQEIANKITSILSSEISNKLFFNSKINEYINNSSILNIIYKDKTNVTFDNIYINFSITELMLYLRPTKKNIETFNEYFKNDPISFKLTKSKTELIAYYNSVKDDLKSKMFNYFVNTLFSCLDDAYTNSQIQLTDPDDYITNLNARLMIRDDVENMKKYNENLPDHLILPFVEQHLIGNLDTSTLTFNLYDLITIYAYVLNKPTKLVSSKLIYNLN